MSDLEDWEKEDAVEEVEEKKIEKKFSDEDLFEEKSRAIEKPKPQKKNLEKQRKKNYDEMFEDMQKTGGVKKIDTAELELKYKDLPEEERKKKLQEESQKQLTSHLFKDLEKQGPLVKEQDYLEYASIVASCLRSGEANYHIALFIKTLIEDLQDSLTAVELKMISNKITLLNHAKRKEEKDKEAKGKAKKTKAAIYAGKAVTNDLLVSDLLDQEEYSDEPHEAYEEEADFM